MADSNPYSAAKTAQNHNNGRKWSANWRRATPEDVFAVAQEVFGGKYWNVRRDAQSAAETA